MIYAFVWCHISHKFAVTKKGPLILTSTAGFSKVLFQFILSSFTSEMQRMLNARSSEARDFNSGKKRYHKKDVLVTTTWQTQKIKSKIPTQDSIQIWKCSFFFQSFFFIRVEQKKISVIWFVWWIPFRQRFFFPLWHNAKPWGILCIGAYVCSALIARQMGSLKKYWETPFGSEIKVQ